NQKTGRIVAARVVSPGDHVTFITSGGLALRTPVDDISRIGRNTHGVQLMDLAPGDTITSLAPLEEDRRLERERALEAEREAMENYNGAAPPTDEIISSDGASGAE